LGKMGYEEEEMSVRHTYRSGYDSNSGLQKFTTGNITRAKAIKLFCEECSGWTESPSKCNTGICVLWPFRTGRIKSSSQRSSETVKSPSDTST
jgi:hypothetical protein